MTNLTFFSTRDELCALTGLSGDKALWDAGFNLDDWDWGFVSDENYMQTAESKYYDMYGTEMCENIEMINYDLPPHIDFLLRNMENYCCGLRHTEYNGKHYYMLYHS